MKPKIKISVVTKTHNHGKFLERLLEKIKTQKNFNNYEIIVIDSSSKDNTLKIAKKYGCRIINIDPKDFTHAYTYNLGAKESKGEIIIFASVDIIPKSEFCFYNLIKHFKNKKVVGVFGKQEPIEKFNTIEEFKTPKMFPEDPKKVVAFFSASYGAIRREIWEKFKFPENIPYQYIGGEDQIWAKDLLEKGYKIIYEPKSIVKHSHKYSWKIRLYHAHMIEKYGKEVKKWNEKVGILIYSKKDLVKYLIKKKAYKELIFDLLFVGILMRIVAFYGKIERLFKNSFSL